MTRTRAEAQRVRYLARLRRVRDRIDRDHAQPLDVEALARGAHMSAGHSQLVGMPPSAYRRKAAQATAGMPPCVAQQVTRPVRNGEAPALGPDLALTAMDLTIAASFLPHDDPDASLTSYRDVLGFGVRNDVGSGAMRWITVGPSASPARRSSWRHRPPGRAPPTTSGAPSPR